MTNNPLKKIIALPNIHINYPQHKKNKNIIIKSTNKLINQ